MVYVPQKNEILLYGKNTTEVGVSVFASSNSKQIMEEIDVITLSGLIGLVGVQTLLGHMVPKFHSKTCLLRLRQSSRSGGSGSLNSGSNKWKNKAYLTDVTFSIIRTWFFAVETLFWHK